MARLLVLEVNEIPLRLLRWYAERRPGSVVAELLSGAAVGESEVREDLAVELYPSLTWASQATGVPYDKHGVHWYGDPKPEEFPLYWQAAAEQRRVGVVGTLHSSPFARQCDRPGVVFAVPDAFAADPTTRPASLEPFQAFNLRMTERNARAVRSGGPGRDWLTGGLSALRGGVRPRTVAAVGALAAGAVTGRIPRERLRTAQFLLVGDVFARLCRDHDPDLAVGFTNHVAAAMHRYWFASFPEDWDEPLYDDSWVARFAGELPAALDALDRYLGRMARYCRSTDRTLVLISSMGQCGGAPLEFRHDHQLVVEEPERFLATLGVDGPFELRKCMVPHVTVDLLEPARAEAAFERLTTLAMEGDALEVDRNGTTLTITYHLAPRHDGVVVDGSLHPLDGAGLRSQPIEDHRCGVHHPRGAVVVANSRTADLGREPFDYLEVAPAILRALGLEPLGHHVEPTVRF
jgi:hypothetical protein